MKNLLTFAWLSLSVCSQAAVLANINFDSGYNANVALQGQSSWVGTGSGIQVTTTDSFSGFFGITRNPAVSGSYVWRELPHNPGASAEKVVAGSIRMRHSGTSTTANDWFSGLEAYTFDVDYIGGLQIEASTGRPFVLGAQGLGEYLPAININNWNLYQSYLDFDGRISRARINGVWQQPAFSIDQATFNDFDLYQGAVGSPTSRVYMDDYVVETLTTSSLGFLKMSGTITMSDFILPESTWVVKLYIVNPVTKAVVDSVYILTDGSGAFTLSTIAPTGVYDVYATGGTFLSKKLSSVNVVSGTTGVNLTLTNGDVVGDDVIDLSDYTAVAVAFNAEPSDSNWNVRADLNGDDVVDLTDYTVIAVNFNAIGDLAVDGVTVP